MWKITFFLALTAISSAVFVLSGRHLPQEMSAMVSELCGTDGPFVSEQQIAMRRMMDGMNVNPSGDPDADFATLMIAHHRGAIDMAQAELRHGRNEQLRRIAQGIIVEQQQEILAMQLALDQQLAPPAVSRDSASGLTSFAKTFMARRVLAPAAAIEQ